MPPSTPLVKVVFKIFRWTSTSSGRVHGTKYSSTGGTLPMPLSPLLRLPLRLRGTSPSRRTSPHHPHRTYKTTIHNHHTNPLCTVRSINWLTHSPSSLKSGLGSSHPLGRVHFWRRGGKVVNTSPWPIITHGLLSCSLSVSGRMPTSGFILYARSLSAVSCFGFYFVTLCNAT